MLVSSCFFFFKQKTAYEMRISDWSSDVCSSDLPGTVVREDGGGPVQCGDVDPPPRDGVARGVLARRERSHGGRGGGGERRLDRSASVAADPRDRKSVV